MHNVVIASPPFWAYSASVATVARDMMLSFQNVRIALMVGIGGGVPSKSHDIRLGDIVVGAPKDGHRGLLQYDLGGNTENESFQITGFLDQPPPVLQRALAGLRAQYKRRRHRIEETAATVIENNVLLWRHYKRPDQLSDRLYLAEAIHPNTKESCPLACDPHALIPRLPRDKDQDSLVIHYGSIASSNQLMKNALLRDKLAAEEDVLCFEVEAAGLMDNFPCLVIRGISDYSDSHKNNEWQGYAAMVAAVYAKDLLYQIPRVTAGKGTIDILLGQLRDLGY
ncbi:uncharacterized protein TrAtP1_001719 [Trichoderma atroviride]|uniref:uncharacterized protein n=1 Tax=Hypocrea atroviridis TaxID=63577 RepID=UPI00332BB222|nr:hypothetical protein TrAtP1_001719 [Trichoderma atroviride]